MLLFAHHSSSRSIGLFISLFSLFLYIGHILFSYIRKHLPIEPKPSGNAPQAPGAHNTQQAIQHAGNAQQYQQTPGAHNTQQATPYAYNTQQYLQTPGVYNTQQATSYVNNAPQQPQAPGAHNTQQATQHANNAPQQPTTPVESTSDKSLATVARLALGILYAFYVCFSFFLCSYIIAWIYV